MQLSSDAEAAKLAARRLEEEKKSEVQRVESLEAKLKEQQQLFEEERLKMRDEIEALKRQIESQRAEHLEMQEERNRNRLALQELQEEKEMQTAELKRELETVCISSFSSRFPPFLFGRCFSLHLSRHFSVCMHAQAEKDFSLQKESLQAQLSSSQRQLETLSLIKKAVSG